jgi:cytoskeletal protein RodZ
MSPPGADRRAPVPNPASGSPGLRLLVFFAVGVLITGALVVAWFVASPGVPEEEVQGLAPPASSLVGSGPPPSPASPAEQPLDADQALVDEAPPVAPAVAPASPAPAASAPSGKVSKPAAPSTSTRAATSPAAAAAPTPEDSEDAEDDVPARIERRAPSAEAAPTAEAAPSTAPASAGRFRLEFRAADPSVTRMEVRCHEGVSGQGGASVVLPEAVRGPCRVTGFQGDTPIVAFVTATGAQNFGCFEGGARTCR